MWNNPLELDSLASRKRSNIQFQYSPGLTATFKTLISAQKWLTKTQICPCTPRNPEFKAQEVNLRNQGPEKASFFPSFLLSVMEWNKLVLFVMITLNMYLEPRSKVQSLYLNHRVNMSTWISQFPKFSFSKLNHGNRMSSQALFFWSYLDYWIILTGLSFSAFIIFLYILHSTARTLYI